MGEAKRDEVSRSVFWRTEGNPSTRNLRTKVILRDKPLPAHDLDPRASSAEQMEMSASGNGGPGSGQWSPLRRSPSRK